MSARKKYPTSAMLISMITRKPVQLPHEAQEEAAATTTDDHDDFVYQAFLDLISKPPCFNTLPDNPAIIECPRERLMRLGEESIQEGKPSLLYLFLLEQTRGGTKLPHITNRALHTAQKRLDIKNAFVDFLATHPQLGNFKEAKKRFRMKLEETPKPPSQAAVDDALKEHHLNWSSYSIDASRKNRGINKK
ncbi:hypothetical protein [Collimonas antrihumi]|uniref:hypothetical protein n=1 Tax=Collimonas antrihumi TaxID=1940615 RepID=UPI001B8C6D3F|nr:hypothetical protein [Collimonas antrihumi]